MLSPWPCKSADRAIDDVMLKCCVSEASKQHQLQALTNLARPYRITSETVTGLTKQRPVPMSIYKLAPSHHLPHSFCRELPPLSDGQVYPKI